jgi:hypothetical protein
MFATFGTKINYVVGTLDHVEIVFNYNHRIAERYQSLENVQEFMNISKVQTGCRFVQEYKWFFLWRAWKVPLPV